MKKINFIGIVLIVLVFSLLIFVPFQSYLVIEPRKNEGTPLIVHIPKDRGFSVRYTHSIHLSEVEEFYRETSSHQIQQTKLLYEDTAIGMPGNAEGQEKFEVTDEGKYLISNMNRKFPYIDMRIGQVVANHRLVVNNNEYPLSDYFDKGSVVRVQFKRLSIYDKWKGVYTLGKG